MALWEMLATTSKGPLAFGIVSLRRRSFDVFPSKHPLFQFRRPLNLVSLSSFPDLFQHVLGRSSLASLMLVSRPFISGVWLPLDG